MHPTQIAVACAQLLTPEGLDRFHEEVHNSPLDHKVKTFVAKEFHHGCDIDQSVKYMMNYHIPEVRTVGFAFDWVLRNRRLRDQRMGR